MKDRLRQRLRRGVHARSLVLGTLTAGVIVSLLESACTGQVYFPVIAGLVRDSATRTRGVLVLLWYNFLFILPLLGVFGAAFFGVGSDRIAGFARRHFGLTKVLLAIVFFGMAFWMWPGLVWPPGVR